MVARRKGQDWFVGAMTDWTPRELEIDLASFLPPATGHVRLDMVSFADGADADRVPTSYRRESTPVTARPRLKIEAGARAAAGPRESPAARCSCKRDVGAGAAPPAPR